MRKDSAKIAGFTVLLAAAIIGGGYYTAVLRNPAPPVQESADAWQTLIPSQNRPPSQNQTTTQANTRSDVPAGTSRGRTDTPIKCQDPERGEYWTNAATCDQADLNNRLSYSAPLATNPSQDKYSGQDYVPPEQQAVNSRTDDKLRPEHPE